MRARDLGPRAPGVELEVALPVTHRLVAAPGTRERAREIEVRVGVVRRDVEGAAVVPDPRPTHWRARTTFRPVPPAARAGARGPSPASPRPSSRGCRRRDRARSD